MIKTVYCLSKEKVTTKQVYLIRIRWQWSLCWSRRRRGTLAPIPPRVRPSSANGHLRKWGKHAKTDMVLNIMIW